MNFSSEILFEAFVKKNSDGVYNINVTFYFSDKIGPDQILPSNDTWTSSAGGRVKIRGDEESLKTQPPISVPGLLHRAANQYPNRIALASKNADGSWTEVTFK